MSAPLPHPRLSDAEKTRGTGQLIILAAVLVATALLYGPVLHADFAGIDDAAYLTANPLVTHPDWLEIFNPRTLTASDWTPLVTASHVLEYRLWGFDAAGYHATNLVLHLLSIVLVFGFLVDLGIGRQEAVLAALVFAFHPLQVESVAWVSARKNLLAAVFGLAFCRAALGRRPLAALLLLLLALGSKGTAIVFPLWLAAIHLFRRRGAAARSNRRWSWLAVFVAVAVGRALLSVTAQADVVGGRAVAGFSFAQRMNIMLRVVARQLRQIIAPTDLAMNYFWTPAAWSAPQVVAAILALSLVVGLVAWAGRQDRRIRWAAVLALIAMLPTLNIVPAPLFQADRYIHLPFVLLSFLLVATARPLARLGRWLPAAATLLVCVLWFAPITAARIHVWQSAERVWLDVLQQEPGWSFGWNQLGVIYLRNGNLAAGENALRSALAADALNADARFNLILLLHRRGDTAAAENEARRLLAQHADHSGARLELALMLQERHELSAAEAELNELLSRDPANHAARYRRAMLLLEAQRPAQAAADFEALIRVEPSGANAYRGLAESRLRTERVAEAVELSQTALRLNPNSIAGWEILERALRAAGDETGAQAAAAHATQLRAAERGTTQKKEILPQRTQRQDQK